MTSRRAPIGRLVDLAVAVPTCTLIAATRAVPIAARVGTLGTARIVERVSNAVYELRRADDLAPVAERPATERPDASERPEVGGEAVPADDLPIDGYDDLAARQVVDRLGALDQAELDRVEVYERRHRNRSTVLGKISMLSA
jgi:hypothetical protein